MDERYNRIANAINTGNIIVNIVSVSSSGMSRRMRFYIADKDGTIDWITCTVGHLLGMKTDKNGCLLVRGCGMDMCFAMVCNLASVFTRDGYPCKYIGYQRV